MDNNIYTIKEAERRIDIFSEYNASKEAYLYYKELKEYVAANHLKETNPDLHEQYYKLLVKLKFLSLNFFDDWENIKNLLKSHFELIYELKDYNLWDKIKIQLQTIPSLDDRDRIKEELKKVLLNCGRYIIDKNKYEKYNNFPFSVADWLRDYNINLGAKEVDNLQRTQYLINSENIKKLDKEDKDKLKILFDFYENLKVSSNTPRGFENDIPMIIEGKHIIFSGGEAKEIGIDIINLIKSIKTGSEKEDKIMELKNIISQYPPNSLERKAIEEEIERLDR